MYDSRGIPRSRSDMELSIESGYVIPEFRDTELSVELLLDYVDLKLDWYIPSIDAIKFFNFIRLCLGEEPENLNSKAHYFFIDCIFQSKCVKPYFDVRGMDFNDLKGNTLILSSREFSKSVLIVYFILYMASGEKVPNFGKVNFGIYVSDRMDGNVKITMETIESLYLGSTYLQSLFEWTHFTDKAVEFIRKPVTRKEIEEYNLHIRNGGRESNVKSRAKRKFKLQGIGSSGGRGSRSGLDRPQFAIFDDLIANEKDAYSQAVLEAIESTIEADIGSSLSGGGNFKVIIGTAYHTNDPVYKRVTEGSYLPVVFPKAEVPPHGDIYSSKGVLVTPAMTKEKFVSVWDDRHPFSKQRKAYALAEKAYAKGKPKKLKTINQEFYVRVTSEHERLIKESDILWENLTHVCANGKDYKWYITTDFTTTNNISSDNSVCFLWAVDYREHWYLIDVSVAKKTISEQYQDTLDMYNKAMKYGAYWCDVGVEIDGQQSLHLINLENYADKQGVNITFASQKMPLGKKATWVGIRSKGSGDKLWRLKLVAEQYHNRQVHFNTSMKYTSKGLNILERELKMTTYSEIKASSDDALDGLSQLALIDIDYGAAPSTDVSYNIGTVSDTSMYGLGGTTTQLECDSEFSKYFI